jgi:hypothetical protein
MIRMLCSLMVTLAALAGAPLHAHAEGDGGPCPRPDAGSIVAEPPDIYSQAGALDVSLTYYTTIDSAGRTLFCLVTLEAPVADPACTSGRHVELDCYECEPATAARLAYRGIAEGNTGMRRFSGYHHIAQSTFPWHQHGAEVSFRLGDRDHHQFRTKLPLLDCHPRR